MLCSTCTRIIRRTSRTVKTIIIKIDRITHADDFMRRISFSNTGLNEVHAVEIMNNKSSVPLRVKDVATPWPLGSDVKLVNMEIRIVKSKSYI